MKVYACPSEVPAPVVDYRNYNSAKVQKDEEKHKADLKAYLINKGFKGKYTGEIVRFGVADGSAEYMLADDTTNKRCFLIHLPYGDGYQYRDVQFLPKKEIIKRIEAEKTFEKLWGERWAAQNALEEL